MRARVNLIIEEAILTKIDAIAGEKQKRAAIIETALLEYIAREEAKAPLQDDGEGKDKKAVSKKK